jgi:hypothetical protein
MTKKGAFVEKTSFYIQLVRNENREGKIGKKNKVGFLDGFFGTTQKLARQFSTRRIGWLDDFSTRHQKTKASKKTSKKASGDRGFGRPRGENITKKGASVRKVSFYIRSVRIELLGVYILPVFILHEKEFLENRFGHY